MAQYVVKSGDTLSRIASQFGTNYQSIAQSNGIANPNMIKVGQVLNIGGGGSPAPSPAPAPQQSQPAYSAPAYNPTGYQSSQQPRSAADLIGMGFSGYAGWNDTEALANYSQTQGAGKGGPSSMSSMFSSQARPSINIQEIYDKAFASPDIGTAKDQIKAKNDEIVKRKAALAQTTGDINDNPWYSEATRVGRVAKLEDRANADIGNFINEVQLAEQSLQMAKAEAGGKVDIAMKQYDVDRTEYQDNLQQLNFLIQSGGIIGANANDIAQIAQSTGIAPSMLQQIVQTQKKANEPKPELQTFDDGTNQWVVAIDPQGNVVNRQIVGQSKPTKASGGGSGSSATTKAEAARESAFYNSIDDGIKQLQSGSPWGTVWNRIKLLYPEIAPEVIDTLLGSEWRSPGAYQNYRQNTSSGQYSTVDPTKDKKKPAIQF